MDIDEILSVLDASTIFIQSKPSIKMLYTGAVIFAHPMVPAIQDRDAVVFCPASMFNMFPDTSIGEAAFFLWIDEPLKPYRARAFVATLASEGDWFSAFELVSSEFRSLQRRKEKILELTSLVNRGASLDTLVNEAAQIVGAPASVLDNSLTFLAVSDDFNEGIARGEEKRSGTLPDDAMPLMKAKGLVNPQKPFDLIEFDYDIGDGKRTNYYSLIHSRDTIIGSISFFTKNCHLRKSRIEMIPTIAQILSIHMQRNQAFLLNKNLYYAHLFKQLEEGTLEQNIDSLRTRFEYFGYRLRKHLHVFVVDLSREYMPAEQAQPLAERLHPLIRNSIYTLGQTTIKFISSNDEIVEQGAFDETGIESILEGTSIVIGVSSIFINPERTPYHIEEARRAISLARKLNPSCRIAPFSDYRMLDLANNVTDQKTLYSYRFPPLVHVIDLDIENNTHLAETLYEYLQNPTHPQAVAEKLFIHKNTLYYRLEKIREIMGRDFKDAETITNIQMTFHVLRIQNRFNRLILRQGQQADTRRPAKAENHKKSTRTHPHSKPDSTASDQ